MLDTAPVMMVHRFVIAVAQVPLGVRDLIPNAAFGYRLRRVMDYIPPLMFAGLIGFVSLAWYIAVILFLYKIWQKVKHLPG